MEHEARPWLRQLREADAQNPELARLMVQIHRNEMEIRDWQHRYHAATGPERPILRDEGRRLIEHRVDLGIERDRLRLESFEQRLHALKTRLSQRQAQRNQIVDHELDAAAQPPKAHTTRPAP